MHTTKILSLIISLVVLSGCETMGANHTQAYMENMRINTAIAEGKKKLDQCIAEIRNNEAVREVDQDIIYAGEDSDNKFSLMMRKEKLTDQQIETFKAAIPHFQRCRNVALSTLEGLPFSASLLGLYNQYDSIYIRLLRNEISIGEANEIKAKAVSEFHTEWAKTAAEIDARIRAAHYSEIQNRQAVAAAALPLLMQQQALQQQTLQHQQAMQQQQLQNMLNNTARPTIYTNCTRYGNQVNCTSR
jgi:hypothetical protein